MNDIRQTLSLQAQALALARRFKEESDRRLYPQSAPKKTACS